MFAFLRRLFAGADTPQQPSSSVEMPIRRSPKPSSPEEASRLALAWTDQQALEGALRDYSGYFRQAAVERCAKLQFPNALTMVATRLNDWVPQVRDAARRAVLELLASANCNERLLTLQVVADLRKVGRANHEEWIAEFESAFLLIVGEQALWDGLANGTRQQSRACFELLIKQPNVAASRLLAQCVVSKNDITLALRGAEATYQLTTGESGPILLAAMTSHFGAVRRVALRMLLLRDDMGHLAEKYLLDKHATVRALSMFYLRDRQFDVAGFYRDVLLNPGSRPHVISIALLSMAGLGSKDDLMLVRSFTGSAAVRVRSSAYAAWLKLSPDEKDSLALQAFADDSISVRKFARLAMERYGAYVAFSDLYRILGQREVTLELMFVAYSHKWNWLEAIVTMARDLMPGSPLAAGLAVELRNWIRNARWSRNRLMGNQALELSNSNTLVVLEALIAGEADLIAQLREQIRSACAD